MAKKCIFFALIFSGLRGCFSKNGVFAYKMNFVENFFERALMIGPAIFIQMSVFIYSNHVYYELEL